MKAHSSYSAAARERVSTVSPGRDQLSFMQGVEWVDALLLDVPETTFSMMQEPA